MSPTHFCASSYRFRDIKIKKKLPSKSISRSQSAIWAITPFDGKCPTHFGTSSYRFRHINIYEFFYLQKSRSRSQSAIFTITSVNNKCQHLQMSPIYFCASYYRFRDNFFSNFRPSKSRPRSRYISVASFNGKCQNLQMSPTHFALVLTIRSFLSIKIIKKNCHIY